MRDNCLGTEKWPLHIYSEDPIPIILLESSQVFEVNEDGCPGAVDEDIYRAEGFHYFLYHGSYLYGAGHIGFDGDSRAAGVDDIGNAGARLVGVWRRMVYRDDCAGVSELPADSPFPDQ